MTQAATTTGGVHPRDIVNKYLWWVIGFIIAIVLTFGIKHEIESRKGPASRTSLASVPSFLKFDIPAHDRVEFLPVPGKHPEVSGFGKFSSHAVREDDTECTSGAPDCVNGPTWKKYYVTNDEESDKPVTVTVTFK